MLLGAKGRIMTDAVEAFLATVMPQLEREVLALQQGDPGPRMDLWSRNDPVTLFGAELSGRGWGEIEPAFRRLAASFVGGESCEYEVLAAGVSADLGYVVAIERSIAAGGSSGTAHYALRVTTVFRREGGAWKVVHRHGDPYDDPTRIALARRTESGAIPAEESDHTPTARDLRTSGAASGQDILVDAGHFIGSFLQTLDDAEMALRNGDSAARPAIWSRNDPVTFFGAALTKIGWDEIAPAFDFLASQFSRCESFENEVIAAGGGGDLAYLVGYEHTTTAVGSAEPEAYVLRVTTILRRENGQWKVVHRHGDPMPDSSAARDQVARMQGKRA
jgi:ketosteroid isomerase-like protein